MIKAFAEGLIARGIPQLSSFQNATMLRQSTSGEPFGHSRVERLF
jgi:hypothetical protein